MSLAQPPPPSILFTDLQNNRVTTVIILVAVAVIISIVGIAAYLYNRQRKIREYKLQKAQAAAAMKLNTPP